MNLKGYRASLNLTQADMAKKLGIATLTYGKKEKGEYEFNQNEIREIMAIIRAEYPDATFDEIFFA